VAGWGSKDWLPYLLTASCLVALVAVLVQAAAMQDQLDSQLGQLARLNQQLVAADKLAERLRQVLHFILTVDGIIPL
jgi:succinate dehydrogenase hydrophobic anchor subunit